MLIYGAIFLVMVAGFTACPFLAFYENRSVIVLSGKSSDRIKMADSLYINPYLSVEGEQRFVACLNFEIVSDSIKVKSLEVKITSIDNPELRIDLTHVLVYKDPINPEYIDYVSSDSFKDLPEHYKTISLSRSPWNTIIFRFETDDFEKSKYYNLRITGTVIYKGKAISFEKEIKAKRKKKFLPIRMMT